MGMELTCGFIKYNGLTKVSIESISKNLSATLNKSRTRKNGGSITQAYGYTWNYRK